MPRHTIKPRSRYFVAVEGESEQSFTTWLQIQLTQRGLPIHLDAVVLGGGGYKSMLANAVREYRRRSIIRGHYRNQFLLLDRDRTDQGDWPISKLEQEASKHHIIVCAQSPNHEGLLLRMCIGHEKDTVVASAALKKLLAIWPQYRKPVNAQTLQRRYTVQDLIRASEFDDQIKRLLIGIGSL
jgi:hypothetical protein